MIARRWHYAPNPIQVPSALLDAFELLKAEAVLVGGSAVQVWVGKRDGVFATLDLDFITPLNIKDLARAGIRLEGQAGRHAMVDGIPIEFPAGPLAVGDHVYSPGDASVQVPTLEGRPILCLRPEASVLDRLAWVAGDRLEVAYAQALAVAACQSRQLEWDDAWIKRVAARARLGKQWKHLQRDLASGNPGLAGLERAVGIGWD